MNYRIKSGLSLRILLAALFVLLLISAVFVPSFISNRIQGDDFIEIAGKPELHEAFINTILDEIGRPSGNVVINYTDTVDELTLLAQEEDFVPGVDILMDVSVPAAPIESFGNQDHQLLLSIYPAAFTGKFIKTRADFVSSLRHELEHIKVIQAGNIGSIPLVAFVNAKGEHNLSLQKSISELDVLGMELIDPSISDHYRDARMNMYVFHYVGLWKYNENMDPGKISQWKVMFFPQFLRIDLEASVKTLQQGFTMTYDITDEESGTVYSLSMSEVTQIVGNKG